MTYSATAFFAQAGARLAELDAGLAKAGSRRDVAWILCEFSGRQLKLADVVVYLVDADGCLSQQAAWGPKRAADQVLESRIRLMPGQGIVGTCATQQLPLRIADTERDPRYVCDDHPNRSELAVPICGGGVLFGVLDSEHPEPGYYDTQHERALLAIAERGAARLLELGG
ncbi:MAG TPA: GAF domain-containing protein [Rhodanobacteraceae bacterium]|nr:GAF domain-containing protein [Rhodanobacteraceae bacterium]